LIRCSWAKPTTSAIPGRRRKSLRPQPAEAPIPDFPIRGYEYYDYRDDVVNTTFVNYQDNDRRKTGALSWLLFTSAGSVPKAPSAVRIRQRQAGLFPEIDPRFDNDNRGGNAYRTLSIHDLDGSVTGIPDSYILLHDGENDSVATTTPARSSPPGTPLCARVMSDARENFQAQSISNPGPPGSLC
jgi:hypothetical protein